MTESKISAADTPIKKVTLEWVADEDYVALLFAKETWIAFESAARDKGTTAQEMIVRAVVHTLGTVVFDRANSETGHA